MECYGLLELVRNSGWKSLRKLNLSYNLCNEGFRMLSNTSAETWKNLKTLIPQGNKIDEEGVIGIVNCAA